MDQDEKFRAKLSVEEECIGFYAGDQFVQELDKLYDEVDNGLDEESEEFINKRAKLVNDVLAEKLQTPIENILAVYDWWLDDETGVVSIRFLDDNI